MTIRLFQRELRRQPAPELRGHRGLREARQGQRAAAGAPVARHCQGGGVQGTEGGAGGVVWRRACPHTSMSSSPESDLDLNLVHKKRCNQDL